MLKNVVIIFLSATSFCAGLSAIKEVENQSPNFQNVQKVVNSEGVQKGPNECRNLCRNGNCVSTTKGENCECLPGYGKYNEFDCMACNCGGDNNCTFQHNEMVMDRKCLCQSYAHDLECNGPVGNCSSSPCKNGGTCLSISEKNLCVCPVHYAGETCEFSNPCNAAPCKNMVTCKATPDGQDYTCDCRAPFSGKNCEKGPCNENPCKNKGVCRVEGADFKCECPGDYIGKTCETKCKCTDGKCRLVGDKGVCECPPGFGLYGSDTCKACDCGTDANCTFEKRILLPDIKYCKCPDGSNLKNKKCEDPCTEGLCKNNGTCTVKGKTAVCICKPPYSGPTCEQDLCSLNPCLNNGICEIKENNYNCNCKIPYYGKKCELGPCSMNPCRNGAECGVKGDTYECKCKNPYSGKTCEDNLCTTNPCLNDGICEIKENSYNCNCKSPHYGKKCELSPCSMNPCRNGGECLVKDDTYECKCKNSYSGKTCEESPCSTYPCKNGGGCEIQGNNFKCHCKKPFNGKTCETDPCSSNPCMNGGTCIIAGETFFCRCKHNYFGNKCQDECKCENGNCETDKSGELKCFCPSGFAHIAPTVCKECDCGEGINCFFDFATNKECLCPEGFSQVDGKCEKVSVNETTTTQGTTAVISTTPTTTEEPQCKNNPCKNGGTCVLTKTGPECRCPYPYAGDVCTGSHWCEAGAGREVCDEGKCRFDFEKLIGRCDCPKDHYYNYYERRCEFIDLCPLMEVKCTEEFQTCKNGTCQCLDNFKLDENKKCVPNFCATFYVKACGENEVCKDIISDPGNFQCSCKENYFFNGKSCQKENKCTVPATLGCEQVCNPVTESCECHEGFELQKDKKSCKLDPNKKCDRNCFDMGRCVKVSNKEECVCPRNYQWAENPWVTFNGSMCIDLCAAHNIPQDLCPDNKCVSVPKQGFKCKCEGKYVYDTDGITCRRAAMCSEGPGGDICKKKSAKCIEASHIEDGYVCVCEGGQTWNSEGVCTHKCGIETNREKCKQFQASCEMDGDEQICSCPPLLSFGEKEVCSYLAEFSYTGELSLALDKYKPETTFSSGVNQKAGGVLLLETIIQDFKASMHLLFGPNYRNADMVECIQSGDKFQILRCQFEVQFYDDPKDQVRIITDIDTCLSSDSATTCFIPPALLLVKKDLKPDAFQRSDPCKSNLYYTYCGVEETMCERANETSPDFQCMCSEGFESFTEDRPFTDSGTVVQRCRDVNECLSSSSCPNNTRCLNKYGSYECLCLSGFRPPNPDDDPKKSGCVDICDGKLCNHGTCEVLNDRFRCNCDSGFTGNNCDIPISSQAGNQEMRTVLIILSTFVVPLILFAIFISYKYRVLRKQGTNSYFEDTTSSTINLQPIRSDST